MTRNQSGLTLLELIVTVAILAVLLGVAIPSYHTLVTTNQMASQTNTLLTALNAARSTAVSQGVNTGVCVSLDSNKTQCVSGTGDWTEGWLIYADRNGNSAPDADEILSVTASLAGKVKISLASNLTQITYNRLGQLTAGLAQQTFTLCGQPGKTGRQIAIAATGRA